MCKKKKERKIEKYSKETSNGARNAKSAVVEIIR